MEYYNQINQRIKNMDSKILNGIIEKLKVYGIQFYNESGIFDIYQFQKQSRKVYKLLLENDIPDKETRIRYELCDFLTIIIRITGIRWFNGFMNGWRMKMFNITDIEVGWLNLHIGDKIFQASYLTNVKEELDYLFDFKSCVINDNTLVKRIYIDGEGDDLYLTAWKTYDKLTIIWEHADFDNPKYNVVALSFNYNNFMKKYNEVWNNVIDNYNKNFSYELNDDNWSQKDGIGGHCE